MLILPALIVVGVTVGALQPWGLEDLLAFGRDLAAHPLFKIGVIVGMAGLFTFGLPGSLGFWLIAPFLAPLQATLILLLGSVGGAYGAYLFSSRVGGGWQPEGFGRRIVRLLSEQGGVLTQTALRVLPGFPHSVVNFAGGVLGLGLVGFLGAAVVGLAFKWGVYASAVHGLVEAVEAGDAMDFRTGLPLIALSILLLGGAMAKRWVAGRGN